MPVNRFLPVNEVRARLPRVPLLIGIAVLLAAISAASVSAAGEPAERQTSRYIVVLEDSVDHPGAVARAQVEQRDGRVGYIYRHALKGYSVELPKGAVEGLGSDPQVKYITPDHRLQPFAQSVPTGINRVFATANEALDIDEEDDHRVDVDVAVIDSGIDFEHPDLNVVERTDCSGKEGETFKCVDESGTDTLGHGTHVAGTIGAIDNGSGVVGVAPGARLWAVKLYMAFPVALFESSTVAGVDWVTAHANEIEVANMSIGCTKGFVENCSSLPALASAISTAVDEGIVFAVAAGNENVNAKDTHPASHPDVITVSAIEDLDGSAGAGKDPRASFSNFGSTIEVAAPGVSILSTVPGGGYSTASGTSMASPHVAGAAAILASQSDPETQGDVEAIRSAILEEGNFSWEDTSGDGIKEPLLDVSDEEVFTPGEEEAEAPSATTNSATGVGVTGATLQGTVDPNGASTTYQFEYGTTAGYGSKAPASPVGIGSGSSGVEVSEPIGGLSANTTYHYRVVATNAGGTTYGEDKTFKTQELKAPTATTESATSVAASGAKLRGNVNPNGVVTTYQFEYGLTTSYGSKAPASPSGIGSGSAVIEVSETVGGLSAETEYHFRVVATNAGGTTYGADKTFVTSEASEESEWEIQPTPNPSEEEESDQRLSDVSCHSGIHCLAVGAYSNGGGSGALVEHWDGEEWTIISPPSGVGLSDVTCPFSVSCAAAGSKEGKAWAGVWSKASGWFTMPVEALPGASSTTFNGVDCSVVGEEGFGECVAVGTYTASEEKHTLAMSWNPFKPEWEIVEAPTKGKDSELNALSCNALGSCVAVGRYVEFGDTHPLAMQWDGEEWSLDSVPAWEGEGDDTYLNDVSCVGEAGPPAECVAVGANEAGAPQTAVSMVWDGEEWSGVTPAEPAGLEGDFALHGVSCGSESQCHSVGEYVSGGEGETKTLVEEWNGEGWSVAASPNPEGNPWSALRGVSCFSATDCVAVGSSGASQVSADTLAMTRE